MRKIIFLSAGLFLAFAFWGPGWAGDLTANQFFCKSNSGARGAQENGTFDSALDRVDPRLGREIWVGDPKYGSSFQNTVTAAGFNKVILRVPAGIHDIAGDLTVPGNVTVKVERGANLAVATGKTLTINGGLEAGLYQIFSGAGTVAFGAGMVKEAYPQWWGAVGDGTTDCTAAFNAALAAHKAVMITHGTFIFSNSLTMQAYGSIYGEGPASIIHLSVAGKQGIIPANYCTIRNFTLKGTYSTYQAGCWAIGGGNFLVDGVPTASGDVFYHRPMTITGTYGGHSTAWRGFGLIVENMVIQDSSGGGISPGPYSKIRNNKIAHCLGEGILLLGDYCQVHDNEISDVPSWGIDLNSSYSQVIGNQVINCGQTSLLGGTDGGGIVLAAVAHANGLTGSIVKGNSITKSDMNGILIVTNADSISPSPLLSDVQVEGNDINDVCKNFTEATGAIACYDNSTVAGILQVDKVTIAKNHIKTAGGTNTAYGLMLRAVKGIKAIGNIISGVGNHGIYIKNHLAGPCTDIHLERNTVNDAGGDGVHIEGTTGKINSYIRVVNNTLQRMAGCGIYASLAENLAVLGNRITDPTGTTAYQALITIFNSFNYHVEGNTGVGVPAFYDGIYIGTGCVSGQINRNIVRNCHVGIGYASNGVGYTTFTGNGLNNAYLFGTYTGVTAPSLYECQIDGNGRPDSLKWRKDGGAWTTGVPITGGVPVAEGVSIHFGGSTGHTIGDGWSAQVGGDVIIVGNKVTGNTAASIINLTGVLSGLRAANNNGFNPRGP